MSSQAREPDARAEDVYRAAFIRLTIGEPKVLAKGSVVSQNNVAREAGKDPSSLKKHRFPALIAEIKHWTAFCKALAPREPGAEDLIRENALLVRRLADAVSQRDEALNLLFCTETELFRLRSPSK